ncbi:hypothetical protein PVE_R2G0735 [Pseudomonas veronii 1YdBTEX2]|uniref:Reverse transcriptase N-terminal domain-containing protein n=1 Tax=Pseudomonas veronii 1YdBTEX2 TaxID=1295141 RepID=A0A1D3K8X4_PSEVE|nr:hypothetical protein PVE_R2G0735 [Pseudomonas veronii 1YdBTEX2]
MVVLIPHAQSAAGTGASSNFESVWPLSWCQIESQVKRLQVRIAKATQEGRWGKGQGASLGKLRSTCSDRAASRNDSHFCLYQQKMAASTKQSGFSA